MTLYFLVHEARRFQEVIRPALGAAWRLRTFAPCRDLCVGMVKEVCAFQERYHASADEAFLHQVIHGFPFDRDAWRLLVGEILLYAAVEIPEIPTAPSTMTCLLAPGRFRAGLLHRGEFAPIEQAHFGAKDLTFGAAHYQPERTGYNDVADVSQLAKYLAAVDPESWTEADVQPLVELTTTEERLDELEMAREWFPQLRDLYLQTCMRGQLIVCDAAAVPG